MMKSRGRAWLMVVAGVLGGLAVAGLALAVLMGTPWGRARACAAVSRAITAGMAGRLEVDGFDSLSLTRVRAHGIRILAPDGKLAISAERADITFDLWDLLAGRYGWERAEIEDGKVYVTEDAQGRINMEETFRSRSSDGSGTDSKQEEPRAQSRLDLRTMVSSDISLIISGGSLPTLRLVNIYGIMRVHVRGDGKVELRFDDYRGQFVRGLPTGQLQFRDVKGQVVPSNKRLLHFDGAGKTEGAEVEFSLSIFTEPKKRVQIDARFPELEAGAVRTLGVAAWSKFSPVFDVAVSFGEPRRESFEAIGSRSQAPEVR